MSSKYRRALYFDDIAQNILKVTEDLAAPGCSWLLLAAPGCYWLLAAPGSDAVKKIEISSNKFAIVTLLVNLKVYPKFRDSHAIKKSKTVSKNITIIPAFYHSKNIAQNPW